MLAIAVKLLVILRTPPPVAITPQARPSVVPATPLVCLEWFGFIDEMEGLGQTPVPDLMKTHPTLKLYEGKFKTLKEVTGALEKVYEI